MLDGGVWKLGGEGGKEEGTYTTPTVWSMVTTSLSNVGRTVLYCVGKVGEKKVGNWRTDNILSKFQRLTLAGRLSRWSASLAQYLKHTRTFIRYEKTPCIVQRPRLHPRCGLHKHVEHVKRHHRSRALLHTFRIALDHFLDIPAPKKKKTKHEAKRKRVAKVNCQRPISCGFLLFNFSVPPIRGGTPRVGRTRERRRKAMMEGREGIVPLINVIDFGNGDGDDFRAPPRASCARSSSTSTSATPSVLSAWCVPGYFELLRAVRGMCIAATMRLTF